MTRTVSTLADVLACVDLAERSIVERHDHSDMEALIGHLALSILGSPRLLREGIERAWHSGLSYQPAIVSAAQEYEEQTERAGALEAADRVVTADVLRDLSWIYSAEHDVEGAGGPPETYDHYRRYDYFNGLEASYQSRTEALEAIRAAYKGPDCYGVGLDVGAVVVQSYPREVALAVATRRPDLSSGDAISTVLTADPTLTADEVIEILDQAAEDWQAELDVEARS